MSVNDANDNDRISSRYVEDASFLRIQNIALGYTLPKNWLKKLKIENAGSSSNLVVISFLFQLSSSFLILLKVVDMFAF